MEGEALPSALYREKMNILQVSHGLPPKENAGVELYTHSLSKALSDLNHQVRIFCREEDPKKEEFSFSDEETDGIGVTRVVNNLTRVPDARVFYDNHFFDRIFLEILRTWKPDLVHFQHIFGLSAYLVWIAKGEGVPVVFTLHDFFILCHRIQLLRGDHCLCPGPLYGLECVSCLDSVSSPRDLRTRLFLKTKNFFPFPIVKWTKRFFIPPQYLFDRGYEAFHRYRYMYEMFKLCDLILTPSQYVKNFFLKYYPSFESKITALPLGIPPLKGQRQIKTSNGKMRFCYFGNIVPIKGLHVLIEAFKTLPRGRASLTIYGSRTPWTENYYDRLKQEASGFPVDFRGSFKREDLAEALSDQDVVILPSIWPETFSIVIREANSLGLPVIASRIGAIPEAVDEGVNGLLFEPRNTEDLKRCMLRFIESPRLVQEMALKMPKPKSMTEHVVELLEIYQGIVGKKG